MISSASEKVRQAMTELVGLPREDVPTPALIVDASIVRENIAAMAEHDGVASMRPHAKSHKCAEIARLQLQAGAVGITTATVDEAGALVSAGIDRILIANEVVGNDKIALLGRLACDGELIVAVDDQRNARALSSELSAQSAEIGVLVEVDVGMGRCGVRSSGEATKLATLVESLPGLRFRGVMGYEGHCVLEANREQRAAKARQAMDELLRVRDAIEAGGVQVEIVSAGGTGTYSITGKHPGITELQVGSYVFMDAAYRKVIGDFEVALTVAATVVSRHGTTLVVDAGTKALSIDFALPTIADHPDATARYVAEEHAVFEVSDGCALDLGDHVELVSGHCCGTVNLHDAYVVVENNVVVDVWQIVGRGPGRSFGKGDA